MSVSPGAAADSVHYIAAAAAPLCAGDASSSAAAVLGAGTYSPAAQGRFCAAAPWTCGWSAATRTATDAQVGAGNAATFAAAGAEVGQCRLNQ
jgi:hypothetical protein